MDVYFEVMQYNKHIMKNLSIKNKKGFTLIELLVVIAIIGILTAIILPNFSTAKAKSRDGRRVSDISQIKLALELYAENCGGVFPVALSTVCPTNGSYSVPFFMSVNSVPKDPLTNLNYVYSALASSAAGADLSQCIGYHLGAKTELGASGISGDVNSAAVTTICTGASADFNGASDSCDTTTSGVNNKCYDVKN